MRHCGWLLGLLSLFSLATHASDWQEIKNEAKGQTVWFNAWGGDTAINRYLDWVSGEMKTHYAINLKIVRICCFRLTINSFIKWLFKDTIFRNVLS